jgi:hypothetical protein
MIFTECKHIFPAMIKARGSVSEIVKDTKGNFGKYATLAGINDAIMPALVANGLTVAQEVSTDYHDATLLVTVETWLCHTSGEYIQFAPLALPVDKPTAQGVGSAITYGRRYALMAALNLSADDDDGQAATDSRPAQRPAPPRPTPPQKPEEAFQEEEVDRYANEPAVLAKRKKANTLGASLYGQKWDDVRHANCGKLTAQRTQSIKGLTLPELDRFVDGLEKLDAKRQAAAHQQEMVQAGA